MANSRRSDGVQLKEEQNDTQRAQEIFRKFLKEFLTPIHRMFNLHKDRCDATIQGLMEKYMAVFREVEQSEVEQSREDLLSGGNQIKINVLVCYYDSYLSLLNAEHLLTEDNNNKQFPSERPSASLDIETLDFILATSFTREERGKINNPEWITMLTEMHHSLIVEQSRIEQEIKHQNLSQSKKSQEQLKSEKKKLDAKQKVFKEIQESFMRLVQETKETDCSPNQDKISPEMKNLHAAIKNFQAVVEKNNEAIDPSLGSKIIRFLVKMVLFLSFLGFTFWGATIGTCIAPGAGTIAGAKLGGVIGGTMGAVAAGVASYLFINKMNKHFRKKDKDVPANYREIKKQWDTVVSEGYCLGLFGRKVQLPESTLVVASTEGTKSTIGIGS